MDEFDYPNTCPQIDNEIGNAHQYISYFLKSMILKITQYTGTSEVDEIADDFASDLYRLLEPIFENTRKTNSDMRDYAETQIQNLHMEISDLKDSIQDKNYKIEELENLLSDYQSDYRDLESEIKILNDKIYDLKNNLEEN